MFEFRAVVGNRFVLAEGERILSPFGKRDKGRIGKIRERTVKSESRQGRVRS